MGRTRQVVVDQDSSWTIREELTWDPSSPVPPEQDYIIVQTGFPVYSSATSSYSQIVIWGVGLVSFGPVTAAQTTFMANLGSTPDLSQFPGDYVAFGFSSTHLDHFQYGVKAGYVYVTSETNPMISISVDGMSVLGTSSPAAFFGMDFGGFVATSASSVGLFYSDLTTTTGTTGADTMNGTSGPETLKGNSGNDHLIGNGGGDHLIGGAGNDLVEGGAGNDRLYGALGTDTLDGGAGNDQLFGGDGNDLLIPGAGSNDIDGGTGTDRLLLDYGTATSSLYFQYVSGTSIATADGGFDTVTNVEGMIVHGSNFADVIIGTGFDDELYGGNGFDLLRGGAGNDLLDGGANSGPSVALVARAGDTRTAPQPIDQFFTLNSDANIFSSTTVPHATLSVPIHTDPFEFDQETNRYVSFQATAGSTLTIDVDGTAFQVDTRVAVYDSGGNLLASNDDFGSLDPGSQSTTDSLLAFAVPLTGTYTVEITALVASDNHTSTFAVNFSLTGAPVPTADQLVGGSGNDTFIVHSASDIIVEQSGKGTDSVRSDVSYTLAANVENMTLTGSNSVNGTGNTLANKITGNSAANTLSGLSGADTLNGAGGNDTLIGGTGADKFVFDSALSASTNVDHITGFAAVDDTIVLDKTVFTNLAVGALASTAFFAGTAAHLATDRIIYDANTGKLYYDADGTGSGAQILFAQLDAHTALTNSDFSIIA
jgi:Ca2+-binding RTX toxin-like protein